MSRPSAQYSVNLRVEIDDSPGAAARLVEAIAACRGEVVRSDVVSAEHGRSVRDVIVKPSAWPHQDEIRQLLNALEDVQVLGMTDRTFALHHGGKLEFRSTSRLDTADDLAMAYTPGVARVCEAIARRACKSL